LPGAGEAPAKREPYWTSQALEDLAYWEGSNRRIAARIKQLVEHVLQQPFTGIGKPEPLRHEWAGYWSRRINKEHRLIYRVEGNAGDGERGFTLSPEEQAELLLCIAQADRGETIPAEEVLEKLARRHG